MNPLQLIPTKFRTGFYVLFGLVALVALAAGAYYGSLPNTETPDWVLGLGGVVVALTPIFAAVATGNVSTERRVVIKELDTPGDDEPLNNRAG